VGGVLKETAMQAFRPIAAIALLAIALAGCANPERSRDTGDSHVPALALARQVCSNCHGVTGVSTSPNFPNLAAQTPDYLVAQLKAFQSHHRADPAGFEYMWGLSRSLTDEQMRGLAAYYAAQAPAVGHAGAQADLQRGASIFRAGLPDRGVPACAGCHGAQAQGQGAFPRLAGQHADYIEKQLKVFQRTDQRPEGALMKPVAHALRREDMREVAAYLQSIPAQ
jgi:cytochrome c553